MSEEKLSIVKDEKRIESFLTESRIAFEAAFGPDSVEWGEVRCALEKHLAEGRAAEFEEASEEDFAYVRERLDEYWKEFGAFRHADQEFLVCNMHMYGGDEDFFAELGGEGEPLPVFTCMEDGGKGVVRFVYRLSDRTVTALEWNGES